MGCTAETLAGVLTEAARTRGSYRFADAAEREVPLPFSELAERARSVAAGLAAAGVGQGDVVALVMPTGPGFFEALFGTLLAGGVPAPLYPPVRLARLDEYQRRTAAMLDACRAVMVVTDARLRALSHHLALPPLRLGLRAVEELRGAGPAPCVTPAPDDVALVQFSSGTTGAPRPIALTHRQLLANIDAIFSSLLPLLPDRAVGVSWLPLYHDMGLIGFALGALRVAPRVDATLVLLPPEQFLARPAAWLRAIARHRAAISASPDFGYGRSTDKVRDVDLDGADLSCWTLALDGAEAVSGETLRRFQARFAPLGLPVAALTPVYGLGEAALAVAFSEPRAPFVVRSVDRDRLATGDARKGDGAELVSVGRPLDGYAIEVRDPAGATLQEGRVGHIHVSGPSLMSGYMGGHPSPIADGWLDTGDLGVLLDGELHVTGRAKDVVVLRGRNHSPHSIEEACGRVPGVRPGCVVAVSVPSDGGERLLVLAERREDRPGLDEDCRRAVRAATGLTADQVVVLQAGALPRTSSGKLRRNEALRQLQAGELP